MKKMIRILAVLTLILALPFVCGAETPAAAPVRVGSLKGPTGMALAHIMAHNDGGYAFTLEGDPMTVRDMVIAGQLDIAAVPINVGAALYNKTEGGVKALSLITRGMLYVLENGDTVHSAADLEGKTITMAGQGATPQYVTEYILQVNDVNANINYLTEHTDVTSQAAENLLDLVILPEPQVTNLLMKNASFRVALDITEAFAEAAQKDGKENAQLSMSVVIARTEFVEAHPEAVEAFLKDLEDSIAFANEHVAEAAQEIADQGIIPSAKVTEKALPSCTLVFVSGEDMQAQAAPLYEVLFRANPKAVGGQVPDENYYLK